jgi:hypothetical protein
MVKGETLQTLEEIREWNRLQEKQPEFSDDFQFGDGEGRRTVRIHWKVLKSDYEDNESGTGTIIFKTSDTGFLVETWQDYKLVRAFSPTHDSEAYTQICEERGWEIQTSLPQA